MPRQLRLRFPKPTTETAAASYAIAECDADGLPFAVLPLDDRGRIDRRPGRGVHYAFTLESARKVLPDGLLLCVAGLEAARLVKLPAAGRFRRILEVWF